jgi:hypothetical protein
MALTRTFGPSALLLLVATVLFVLAAFDVHTGQFESINVAEFGLAAFAASFLV